MASLCPQPLQFVPSWTLDSVSTNGIVADLTQAEACRPTCAFLTLLPPTPPTPSLTHLDPAPALRHPNRGHTEQTAPPLTC